MRLIRAWYLIALIKVSHWCTNRAGELFDQIDHERRLKEMQRRGF